jgi:TPR repeat protein
MKQGNEKVCSAECAAGDQGGCVALGLLHLEGTLMTQDAVQAARLFETASMPGTRRRGAARRSVTSCGGPDCAFGMSRLAWHARSS